ncbi:hypothetical protein SDC9_207456 [bioreactor metagenome]|uniref:Uncharacterized protein n=1 Tax=bioreactor metagenome TaxID=1076179 RepID=A0A645JHA6_9ZZZZ
MRACVANALAHRLGWMALEAHHPDPTALMTYRLPAAAGDAAAFVHQLWRAGINVSCIGYQQARWALESMDAPALLRLTPHYVTNEEEIDRLAETTASAFTAFTA